MTKVTIRFSPELAEDIRLGQAIFETAIRQALNEAIMAEFIPNDMRIIEGKATVIVDRPLLESGQP